MGALFSFAYGVAAYAAGLTTLLYFIGFTGNLLVPKSVDSGTSTPLPDALAVNLMLLVVFALQHSVMARQGFKRWWTRVVPKAVERSTYLVATAAALAALMWLWVPIREPLVWQAEEPLTAALLWSLFGLGWVVLLVSTFLIDHFELFGLQQVFLRLRGRSMPEPRFRTPLLYRWVRHPIYFGVLLSLWSGPVMTAGRLLLALGFSTYVLIGIWFEERDLIGQFGEHYRRYRDEVGMLLPWRSRS